MFAIDPILYSVLICINFVNLNLTLYYMYCIVDAGKLKNLNPSSDGRGQCKWYRVPGSVWDGGRILLLHGSFLSLHFSVLLENIRF